MSEIPLLERDKSGISGVSDILSRTALYFAVIKIPLDHFFDDRPEVAILLLKTSLVFRQEPVEVMEQHPVKDGPLRMSGKIEFRHGGRAASRNGPRPGKRPQLLGKGGGGSDVEPTEAG